MKALTIFGASLLPLYMIVLPFMGIGEAMCQYPYIFSIGNAFEVSFMIAIVVTFSIFLGAVIMDEAK